MCYRIGGGERDRISAEERGGRGKRERERGREREKERERKREREGERERERERESSVRDIGRFSTRESSSARGQMPHLKKGFHLIVQ